MSYMDTSKDFSLMAIKRVVKQGITYPFGDHRSVKQAFPAAIPVEDADPFLMCDYFAIEEKSGLVGHEDDFPVAWHPHRGFDIASYLKSGTGRHADSLGNRETYDTPGMQWMSTGSGVEHAEGGANAKGVFVQGFQIWINVPAEQKMAAPRYGTVAPQDIPSLEIAPGVEARVLAGKSIDPMRQDIVGPFQTTQPVQMVDLELDSGSSVKFSISDGLDTAMLYVYEGNLSRCNAYHSQVETGHIILFDAETTGDSYARSIELSTTEEESVKTILFAGKKLKQPIAWHGPIVMNTQQQVIQTIQEIQSGNFPPKRVAWNYKQYSEKP
ncbi:MAG: pirin family protein [Spirochaetota bacterium]